MYSFKGWQNNKNHAFPSKRCIRNEKSVVTHLKMEIICTYLHIICSLIRQFYLLRNILAYCGYSPTSPFFLLLSEHKHCDNAATNWNSENVRSRMVASLLGSVGTGSKEHESSTGRVWATAFHRVTARCRLARF